MAIEFFPSREILLSAGFFTIYWYGVLYVAAFGVAWFLFQILQSYRGLILSAEQRLELFAYAITGVLLGGRLGYVFLYDFSYYLSHPLHIFFLQQGGMASHGGFLGVGLMLWLVGRRLHVDYFSLLDVIVIPAALGLALGRVGNIINLELFETSLSQWFAVLKNVFVAAVCYWCIRSKVSQPGFVTGVFFCTYSILRLVDEQLRVQHYDLVIGLTRGQWYTIPFLVIGVWLLVRRNRKRPGTYYRGSGD